MVCRGRDRLWVANLNGKWLIRRLVDSRRDLMQPAGVFEQFAGARAVGRAYQAVALHEVDEVSGAAVADAQAALQQRRRGFAEFEDQADGVVEELVVVAFG